jgi:hypothetical protein
LVSLAREASEGIEIDIFFADSSAEVRRILSEAKVELVLGSSIERSWSEGTGAALVEVANPLRDELVLEQSLAGTRGALSLVSRISRILSVTAVPGVSGVREGPAAAITIKSPEPTAAV